jgi:hypothetical protein
MISDESAESLAQSLRWVVAGTAGAAFAESGLLSKGISFQAGFLIPTVIGLAIIDFLIRRTVEPDSDG